MIDLEAYSNNFLMKVKLLLLFLILNFGCISQNGRRNEINETQSGNSFYTIDFAGLLENKMEVPISEIAESIEYVPLETNDKSVLTRVRYAEFSKDFIFIQQYGISKPLLIQFDKKGKFIRYIGRAGNGPVEYDLIRKFSIDEENNLIYIQSNSSKKILVYSFEGKYIKTINIRRDETEIVWSRDSLFMCFREPTIGNEKYVFTEINSDGEILQTVKNYCLWKDPPPFERMRSYPGLHFFYRINNDLHFKGVYNDTVYTYDSNNKIVPKFSIDLKKFKIPDEMIIERGLVKRIPTDYFWISATESSRYVFILYCAYDTDDPQGHKAPEAGYMIYDKNTKSGRTLRNKEGVMKLFNEIGDWGFKNDIDAGPELIPEYTNDSLAFHFISSITMKRYLESDEFLSSTPRYPDRKKMLLDQMKGLNESDNDILMIVKLK
jgi:hypothetical protein